MAINTFDASSYIEANVIDIEDWQEADEEKKLRILNVSQSTLTRKFSAYTIPDEAVYDFAAVLAIAFNDTNRMNNHGVASYSITGVASFNFKDTQKRDIDSFIPKSTLDLISEANDGVSIGIRSATWTVL